jgi:hypothetical protein
MVHLVRDAKSKRIFIVGLGLANGTTVDAIEGDTAPGDII